MPNFVRRSIGDAIAHSLMIGGIFLMDMISDAFLRAVSGIERLARTAESGRRWTGAIWNIMSSRHIAANFLFSVMGPICHEVTMASTNCCAGATIKPAFFLASGCHGTVAGCGGACRLTRRLRNIASDSA